MPMLISHSLSDDKYKHFDVYSPDTDVLIELMDLVSTPHKPENIDIRDRVWCVGERKSQALLGFHIFTGGDHGNKWVGITKQTWCKLFFNLPDDSHIIDAFIRLGTLTTEESLNEVLYPLAQFMCMAYDPEGPHTIPELLWKLWSKKNKEAENLPPSVASFIPLLQRTNLVGRV